MAAMISSARPGSSGSSTAASEGGRSITGITNSASETVTWARSLRRVCASTFEFDVLRAARYSNLGAAVVPFLALIAAAILSWNSILHWSDLAIFAVMYVLVGLGMTVGFHRLLTHRAFATYKPVAYGFAVAGSMAVQGPVIGWVADHRKHHAHTDEEGDPHSPHVGHGDGLAGSIKGLWWAHLGWLLDRHGQADPARYARDVHEDAGMQRINRWFIPLVIAGCCCRSPPASSSPARWRAPPPRCCGAGWSACASCTT